MPLVPSGACLQTAGEDGPLVTTDSVLPTTALQIKNIKNVEHITHNIFSSILIKIPV